MFRGQQSDYSISVLNVMVYLGRFTQGVNMHVDYILTCTLWITFTQGLRLKKMFLQSSIPEVKSCFTNTNNNVINKYWYWYPCFVYLRKICYDKGRLIFKQRKLGLFFIVVFSLLWSSVIEKVKLLRVFFISFYIFYGCVISYIIVYHWLACDWKNLKNT